MNKVCKLILWLLLTTPFTLRSQEIKKLSLDEAVQLGLENSKALKMAKSRIDAAQAKYQQLKSLQYPQVKASAGYSYISPVPKLIFPGQTQSLFPYIADNTRF